MDIAQVARQVKYSLTRAEWEEGEPVFDPHNIRIYAGPPGDQLPTTTPFAAIRVEEAPGDDAHPDLPIGRFSIYLGTMVMGDPYGEASVLGAAGGYSRKGILAVRRVAARNLLPMSGNRGFQTTNLNARTGPTIPGQAQQQIATVVLEFSARCSAEPYYDSPVFLRHNGTYWLWNGDRCNSRFDFVAFVLRRRAGAVAPVDASDGEEIYRGLAPTAEGAAEAGYSYGIFAEYSDVDYGIDSAYSSPVIGSSKVVVV